MPDYELHADYDRNGRLTATRPEYDQRHTAPGAILVANLDRDDRALPAQVNTGSSVAADWQSATRNARDNDLTPVRIVVNMPRTGCTFFLRITGRAASRVIVLDHQGHPINAASANRYPLTITGTSLDLRLEARTLAGSPSIAPGTGSAQNITVELLCVDGNGTETVLDSGQFAIAPLLLLDDLHPAERLYMAEVPENVPSVTEMRAALQQLGIPFVTVPATVNHNDGWLQDQFQMGYTYGPASWMQIAIHLPRVRANFNQSQLGPNLAEFVETHLTSRNLGVFEEFRTRAFPFRDASGTVQHLTLEQGWACLIGLTTVFRVHRLLLPFIARPATPPTTPTRPPTFFQQRTGIGSLLTQAERELDRRIAAATDDGTRQFLRAVKRDLRDRVTALARLLPVPRPDRIQLRIANVPQVEVLETDINQLLDRLQQGHSGYNYGGNLEVSPPVPNAPLGKIVLGDLTRGGLVDPDLRGFLVAQGEQPLVTVDTSWLGVGHVDEMMAFVGRSSGTPNFAVVRASPAVALDILNEARALYVSGLPLAHPQRLPYRPSPVMPRKTQDGQHPVTHMLRGKLWLHQHPMGAAMPTEPPLIYRKMAEAFANPLNSGLFIPFLPGEHPQDRQYHANLSIFEMLFFERDRNGASVNDFIETDFLAGLDSVLGTAFPGAPILKIPVLYDAIVDLASWQNDARDEDTGAFLPNLANMVVFNRDVLVPRPYGPRMRAVDAITVLNNVLRNQSVSGTPSLNTQWFTSRGLNQVIHWAREEPPFHLQTSSIGTVRTVFSGIRTATDIAEQFHDGFPGQTLAQVEDRIVAANPQAFDSSRALNSGWRRLIIPENTVDLFQAYTQIILESVGLRVRWIDSWFYHVRLGEIHCGTNVIRRPRTTGSTTGSQSSGAGAAPPLWWESTPVNELIFTPETVRGRARPR